MACVTEIEQIFLKFVWKHRKSRIAKANLRKNKAGGTTYLGFKLYYKAVVIQTVLYWHRTTHIDERNTTESQEVNPQYMCYQWINDKGANNIQWEKGSLFHKNVGKTRSKRMKLDYHLTPYTKVNSKWIIWTWIFVLKS